MRPGRHFSGMGASSILLIFVVLCLTTFGMLSLVSAQADMRLAEKSRSGVESYYAADALTETALCDLDAVLISARTEIAAASSSDTRADFIAIVLRGIESLPYAEIDGDSVTIQIPIEDSRYLRTVVSILPPENERRYEVTSRRTITVVEWEDEAPDYWIPDE